MLLHPGLFPLHLGVAEEGPEVAGHAVVRQQHQQPLRELKAAGELAVNLTDTVEK